MSDEVAKRYRKDRAATAAMPGFDLDKLSAAQSVRLDRVIGLRILIDNMQLKQLHGEIIDVKEFVAASESLERLVGGQPDQPNNTPNYDAARLKFETMINNAVADKARKMAADPAAARAEFEATLAQAIADHPQQKTELPQPVNRPELSDGPAPLVELPPSRPGWSTIRHCKM
jgi:hypothetical protein